MHKYSDIFDVNSTVLPFTADQLNSIVKSEVSCGFVPCNYSELLTVLKQINKSAVYKVTLNADEIIKNNTDPTKNINVIIQVEGNRKNNIYDAHIESNEIGDFCAFNTYSAEFKSEIYEIKRKAAKKFLCTYDAINTWAAASDVAIAEDMVHKLCNDFNLFEKYILSTSDLLSFVDALPSDSAKQYIAALNKLCIKTLQKYKNEVLAHLKNITKLETTIEISNPIIVKIFALSSVASLCKRDWPTLPVVSLDRRSFDSLSWYV